MSSAAATTAAAVKILIVEKSGIIKEHLLKSFVESELYKKAGFKNADGFELQTEWNIDNGETDKSYSISIYAKTTGRAGQENKYEFPPPIDQKLFFGSCVIVNKKGNQAVSLSAKEWETIYEYLYGGFEDIAGSEYDDDDDEDSADDETVDETRLTKSGYLKDDFIVEDDEDEEDDDDEDDDEEDEEDDDDDADADDETGEVIRVVATKKKPAASISTGTSSGVQTRSGGAAATGSSKKGKKAVAAAKSTEQSYLDCTSELEEEDYV
jgi:hypothetical protein